MARNVQMAHSLRSRELAISAEYSSSSCGTDLQTSIFIASTDRVREIEHQSYCTNDEPEQDENPDGSMIRENVNTVHQCGTNNCQR
jgi:hypothetical protein